ncbi:MAG: glycosyltransferase family 2 protein [bacterium]|nr:glycosyltransferase family 2 protein [bacterium]
MTKKTKSTSDRLLEFLPGLTSYSLIIFPVVGSFFSPLLVAYYILFFDLLWLYKSITMTGAAIVSYFRIKASEKMNWLGELKAFGQDAKKVHHIIVVPTYKEPIKILERTLNALAAQDFPKQRMIVAVGGEAREDGIKAKLKKLEDKYKHKFGYFITTIHPDLPGEVKGKSSNSAWIIKQAVKRVIEPNKIPVDYTTATSLDADVSLHPKYYSYLTFKFLDDPDRYLRFWQPGVMFYNNFWSIPAPGRVVNTFSTIWMLALLSRPDRLVNFSSYSLSLKMLQTVGYWDADVIPEDYRIFFKCFFHFGGQVEVIPIFLPAYADAAEAKGYFNTLKNQYEQLKRWAWGVSDDPYVIKKYLTTPNVSFFNKTIRLLRIIEDHFLWPVNWFVITIGVNIVLMVNPYFSHTIIGYTLPKLSSFILSLTLISLVVILIIDSKQRPKRPKWFPRWRAWLIPLEFILMPIVGFFFNALPGLDAHTRLMLGKYLEYRVTEKVYHEKT